MKTSLYANGKYVLLKSTDPIDEQKSELVANQVDLNPNFLFGVVLNCGDECDYDYEETYVYVNKFNALKLNHNNIEYYIVREEDIFLTVQYEEE